MNDDRSSDLTPDAIFDLLAAPRRRFILAYLLQQNRPVSVSELAHKVAAWESNMAVSKLDPKYVDQVLASLYDDHLPKLSNARLVSYRSGVDTDSVKLTDVIEDIEADLDYVLQLDPHEYHID